MTEARAIILCMGVANGVEIVLSSNTVKYPYVDNLEIKHQEYLNTGWLHDGKVIYMPSTKENENELETVC